MKPVLRRTLLATMVFLAAFEGPSAAQTRSGAWSFMHLRAALLANNSVAGLPPSGGVRIGGCQGLVHVPFPMSLQLLQLTNSGLLDEQGLLNRMRMLAFKATQETTDPFFHQVLNSEYQLRIEQLDRISAQQSFLGIPLLNGTQDVCLEGAPPLSVVIFHDLPDATAHGLDILGTDLETVEDALMSLAKIKRALDAITRFRSEQKQAWWLLV